MQTDIHSNRTATNWLNRVLHYASTNGFATAVWQLPNTTTTNILLARTPEFLKETPLEELPAGFLFAPFDKKRDRVFLPQDVAFTISEKNELIEVTSRIGSIEDAIRSTPVVKKSGYYTATTNISDKHSAHKHYHHLVSQAIAAIEAGVFEKVVPSRYKTIDLPTTFNLADTFQRLATTYTNAMVSCVSIPEIGTWLGATPELLVEVTEKQFFKTVALAGTKAYTTGTDSKHVAWTQKEIEEQALVARYIINCFKKIRLREFDEHGPKTIIAGNLMHLKTELTVDMQATNFPLLGSVMLNLLHPTSAVCGMPLEPAEEFIKNNEGYDREFYSGYLGPVNINDNTSLFVNLRCASIQEHTATVYSGAGVTIDSDPQKEWEETEMKMNTLLRVIA